MCEVILGIVSILNETGNSFRSFRKNIRIIGKKHFDVFEKSSRSFEKETAATVFSKKESGNK